MDSREKLLRLISPKMVGICERAMRHPKKHKAPVAHIAFQSIITGNKGHNTYLNG